MSSDLLGVILAIGCIANGIFSLTLIAGGASVWMMLCAAVSFVMVGLIGGELLRGAP